MGAVTKIFAYLNGSPAEGVRGLDELQIDTSFISDSRSSEIVQPVITTNELTFVNEAAREIINYQLGGLTGASVGILEGMPLQLYANDGANNTLIFDGFLDFSEYEQISANEVVCKVTQSRSMNSFDVISRVTFFNILQTKGVYNQSDFVDVPYIVQRLDNEAEAANLALTIYVLTVQLIQQAKEIQKDVANITAHTTGGVSGPISGLVYLIAIALIDVIVFLVLLNQLLKLVRRLVELYVPIVQRYKGIREFDLIEKAVDHLGLSFETNIDLMKECVYLPARPFGKATDPFDPLQPFRPNISSGLPKPGQAGQTLAEFIEIMLNKYFAKVAIIDNTLHIRSANDPFWIKNSTYILPDWGDEDPKALNLQIKSRVFNINEFNANRKISFADDVSDEYTANEWRGTNFMVITEPENVNDQNNLLFDGLDDVNIPLALGTRKSNLNEVEFALLQVLRAADGLSFLFGGAGNLSALITDRLGALKLSQTIFNIPKTLIIENGRIPISHRDRLNARILYEKYHSYKSFVNTEPSLTFENLDDSSATYRDEATPNYGNQKIIFNELVIPFDQANYLEVNKNSYLATNSGKVGKIDKLTWTPRECKAAHSFTLNEIWTKNLKETFIEPV